MAGSPRDLADRMAARHERVKRDDGFVRETFRQPRDRARQTARAFFDRFPKQAYMSEVERWREMPGGDIEFTMRRLPTAD
jgi:broad specificity phosphatase PhoE